jgi:hypothetical protein
MTPCGADVARTQGVGRVEGPNSRHARNSPAEAAAAGAAHRDRYVTRLLEREGWTVLHS